MAHYCQLHGMHNCAGYVILDQFIHIASRTFDTLPLLFFYPVWLLYLCFLPLKDIDTYAAAINPWRKKEWIFWNALVFQCIAVLNSHGSCMHHDDSICLEYYVSLNVALSCFTSNLLCSFKAEFCPRTKKLSRKLHKLLLLTFNNRTLACIGIQRCWNPSQCFHRLLVAAAALPCKGICQWCLAASQSIPNCACTRRGAVKLLTYLIVGTGIWHRGRRDKWSFCFWVEFCFN